MKYAGRALNANIVGKAEAVTAKDLGMPTLSKRTPKAK